MTEPHQARKRFGQNFLSDPNIIRKIIEAIRPQTGDRMVEIGPGLGAMTEPLMARLDHLHVCEIDRDLIARLKEKHPPEQLSIHEGDALRFDFASLVPDGAPLRVVGNLPYNISTPILFHLAEFADKVKDMTFMLQKEVVMRMVAEPGTEEYGRLSVMLQYRFQMARVFDVPPGAFRPAPKVMSSIVRMVPRPVAECTATDPVLLGRIVTAAFGQRRKTLRNTLKDYLSEADYQALALDPGLRGEKLGVETFVAMANHVAARDARG
ncbi:16S rRNA (adenine(1518)-N(6)/adenine(1519)-N(6))-dimethyltransferase RsmA [Zoogloea sp.]|uniref:16S rRNA (adenine(1518)-N(6)/adenine(1519)-N(6))- dimethyltransferase RsmA n=1 Tax=Zoogloea sp. TaxID=49181 RepID=UPI0026040EC5|nr:16S rRNA (adenine(1518)-N(6)/adenine(1519)-N(6))-dimethyltransferase RsmA [Zoogloea sp.]MDD3352114.1 16S rRNA (adenine(1518)-N(6)/adenine(1519)-N(6))-dimethyltransferase RsmA [Zoogloea sp.]